MTSDTASKRSCGRLCGKTALITAAGQGIGRKTAEVFASEGAIFWASDVNEAALAGLDGCRPLRLTGAGGDIGEGLF